MKQITDAYQHVFDTEGNVKLCGREACKKLIRLLTEKFPERDLGNTESGMMNVPAIKESYCELCREEEREKENKE